MAQQSRNRMFRYNRKRVALLILALALSTGNVGSAQANNFADDWVSQTSGTDAGYYKGANRGYFTGGSFSARWPQSNDHLMTISKPRIKSGCGGIDMFLGGFSFLNVDQLVQKLQRILSAAPAAAFDIALKTLAPQVADTIKSLEAIIDKLNNLQIDDCKAAKALVGVAAGPFASGAVKAELDSAKADFMQTSGANDLYKTVTDTFKSEEKSGSTPTAKAAAKAQVANCPAPLKAIFSGDSVLEAIGAQKGIPSSHIASIRGFIGDVAVIKPDDTGSDYDTLYSPPCGKSTFEGMIDGTAQIMDEYGTCQDSSDTNKNLTDYVTKRLINIANSLKNKSALDATDIQFINSIPLPIWPAMRAAVQSGTEAMVISKLSDVAARGLAYQIMIDMYTRVYQIIAYADQVKSTQNGAVDGAPTETCQLATFEKPFSDLKLLGETTQRRSREAYNGFNAAASNAAAVESLVSGLDRFNNITRQGMTSLFNRGVSNRATGRL